MQPRAPSLTQPATQSPRRHAPALINFCLHPHLSLLHCSSVSADGFPVSNLASPDPLCRAKGFRVERFIRPPVHIELQFTVPVSLACILLRLDLADGSEARIEISAASSCTGQVAPPGESELRHCGGVTVKAGNSSIQLIQNRAFKGLSDGLQQSVPVPGSSVGAPSSLTCSEHALKSWSGLSCVSTLRLSITRLSGVRPVAVNLLEVWASLGPGCGEKERQAVVAAVARASQGPHFPLLNPIRMFNSSKDACMNAGRKDLCRSTAADQFRPQPWTSESSGPASSKILPPSKLEDASVAPVTPDSVEKRAVNDKVEGNSPRRRRADNVQNFTGLRGGKHLAAFLDLPMAARLKPHCQTMPAGSGEAIRTKWTTVSSGLAGFEVLEALSKSDSPSGGPVCPGMEGAGERPRLPSPEAPHKFFDELTYDLMQIPMLLPSGHCVDRSTLDRLRHMDLAYGRLPLDPFTGSQSSKRLSVVEEGLWNPVAAWGWCLLVSLSVWSGVALMKPVMGGLEALEVTPC